MGQNLSEPVTEKDTSLEENHFYKVGCSSMQGWRNEMEDAHTCLLELNEDKEASFFAVFDGHGGHDVARVASQALHKTIINNKSYRKQRIQEAIIDGYLILDHELLTKNQHNQSGSTAISVLIRDNKIYCGNVGDSRAIASVAGEVELLSNDHKPNLDDEHLRIISAGGWVEFNRVNGNLALSRALGDFVYKRDNNRAQDEQIVIAKPEVMVKQLTSNHEFIVLACDGIWDVMTNEEVVEFVRSAIAEGTQPDTICEKLMTRCLAPDCRMGGVGCDNMTVIIVCLLQGQSYSELSRKCARPSTSAIGSLMRERSINDMVDGDDDEEWYDCADDLLLTASAAAVANDNTSNNETSVVVRQDDEMRLEGEETRSEEEMEHDGEEEGQQNEELRQDDGEMKDEEVTYAEEVKHEDEGIRQEDKETREDEDLEQMEVVTSTQIQQNSEQQDEQDRQDGTASLPHVEEVNDSLSSNGDHDNQTKDIVASKQANNLSHVVFKSTAV